MNVRFFRSLWGMHLPSLEENIAITQAAGFDGVEYIALPDQYERQNFSHYLQRHNLKFILQLGTGSGTGPSIGNESPENHCKSLQHEFLLGIDLNPLFINAHTGRDIFSLTENQLILDQAANLESQYNIPILHETHRGRATATIPATLDLLSQNPHLKLTSDLSHWTCTHESLLEDQKESLSKIAPHVHHIHARIGDAQCPQVSDPRDLQHQNALLAHMRFWKEIIIQRHRNGHDNTTVTVEFGPPPYYRDHFSGNKLWEINCWMFEYLKEHLTLD